MRGRLARPKPSPARPRRDHPSDAASAGSPFACTPRAGGARRGSRGRAGGGRRREREEMEQVKQEGDHQARSLARPEPRDQPLAHRMEFWRGTPHNPWHDAGTRAAYGKTRARRSIGRGLETGSPGTAPAPDPTVGVPPRAGRSCYTAFAQHRPPANCSVSSPHTYLPREGTHAGEFGNTDTH
jgi:hypothetical protein